MSGLASEPGKYIVRSVCENPVRILQLITRRLAILFSCSYWSAEESVLSDFPIIW